MSGCAAGTSTLQSRSEPDDSRIELESQSAQRHASSLADTSIDEHTYTERRLGGVKTERRVKLFASQAGVFSSKNESNRGAPVMTTRSSENSWSAPASAR